MAGLYIHIPFCKKRCHYCDFYSTANLAEKNELLQSILLEMEKRKDFFEGESINTLYFGGGTPSLLQPEEISLLLSKAKALFPINSGAEITLEANPDDLSIEYIRGIRSAGINRLSIGIQSFHDEDLKLLNRRHSASQAVDCVNDAFNEGFGNLTIDLIYGLPGMSRESWTDNIRQVLELPVVHLSAYHLSIEEGTAFHHMLKKNTIREATETESLEQFGILIDMMNDAGFEQYEISNFAREKKFSRHNSAYWNDTKYLGLGPSAHSYNRASRQWNVRDVKQYIQYINSDEYWYEGEVLNEKDKMNEFIMVSLRTMQGLDLSRFTELFDPESGARLKQHIKTFVPGEIIEPKAGVYCFTRKGIMISDYVIEKLFFE